MDDGEEAEARARAHYVFLPVPVVPSRCLPRVSDFLVVPNPCRSRAALVFTEVLGVPPRREDDGFNGLMDDGEEAEERARTHSAKIPSHRPKPLFTEGFALKCRPKSVPGPSQGSVYREFCRPRHAPCRGRAVFTE